MIFRCPCGAKEDMSHAKDEHYGERLMVATYLCETCGCTNDVWYRVEKVVFEKGQTYREM